MHVEHVSYYTVSLYCFVLYSVSYTYFGSGLCTPVLQMKIMV